MPKPIKTLTRPALAGQKYTSEKYNFSIRRGFDLGRHGQSTCDCSPLSGVPSIFGCVENYRTIVMNKFRTQFAFSLCIFLVATQLHADVIIGTDFEGTTENGQSLEDVTYQLNGVTVASSASTLTVNNTILVGGDGNLFTTAPADGSFAVNNNTGNGGEFNTTIDFTTLSDSINLTSFEYDYRNFGGNGGNQFALRDTEVTVDIIDVATGQSVFGGVLVQNTPVVNTGNGNGSPTGNSGTQFSSFDISGFSLAANTQFQIFLQAGDATTIGNNFGFDAFRVTGEIAAVPEPSSLAVLGVCGLFAVARRRRKLCVS